MDPTKIEAAITPKTKAILAVETFGNPAHMNAYAAVAAKHEIPLIEDCCEALGAKLGGRAAGSFGRAGVFAFYANKQITTGEGGMIVTDDDHLADACRSMRNQGRRVTAPMMPVTDDDVGPPTNTRPSLDHVRLGYNYRLSEIHAAIGVAQMSRLHDILSHRRDVAETYISRLIGNPHLVVPTLIPDASMSWFLFVTRLAAGYTAQERDRIMRGMQAHEIGAAPYFPCIHLQSFYKERFGHKIGDFPIAESVSQRTIALPFFTRLAPREIDLVVQTLELMIEREQLSRS